MMSEARDSSAAPPQPLAESAGRTRRRRLILGLVAVLLLGGIALAVNRSFFSRSRPADSSNHADPRRTYQGPLGNIHPDVAYVSEDSRCAPCHKEIYTSYQRHPMGRSLAPISVEDDDGVQNAAHHIPFDVQGFHFDIERREGQLRHRVSRVDAAGHSLASIALPVHFVLGSGTRGRSYLSEQDGFLFQTPISWFSQKQIWDLSPGFPESWFSGRPVNESCLLCHTNRIHPREGTVNRFERPLFSGHAIGCERCHGPGERHLQTLRPLDVVNPKRLSEPSLRDAVCEQCHLKGEMRVAVRGRELMEFRPGLAFSDFCTVFVPIAQAGDEDHAVSHFEQMHASRCYQQSRDEGDRRKLGCISCHDPHRVVEPAERTTHFRKRCLQCHEAEHPCSLALTERRRQQPEDSCIACHMPRFQAVDIAHTAVTDHRIPRRPRHRAVPKGHCRPDELVPFHPAAGGPAGHRRDLGLALVNMLVTISDDPHRFAAAALPLLENAVAEDPEDVSVWQARGIALTALRRPTEALTSFESALRRRPGQELCLAGAAESAGLLNQMPRSRDYWLRAVEANPWQPQYCAALVQLLLRMQDWSEAKAQCRAWKRLQPWSSEASAAEITCLLHEGDRTAAREEFARLEALRPPDLEQLKAWFKQQLP